MLLLGGGGGKTNFSLLKPLGFCEKSTKGGKTPVLPVKAAFAGAGSKAL